jgi:hypothetical protein
LSPHGKNSADCQEEEKVLQMVAAVIVEEVDLFFLSALVSLKVKTFNILLYQSNYH